MNKVQPAGSLLFSKTLCTMLTELPFELKKFLEPAMFCHLAVLI